MMKVSAFYLERQKSFIPEKKMLGPLSISKQKIFVYWLNFLEGFALELWIYDVKVDFVLQVDHIIIINVSLLFLDIIFSFHDMFEDEFLAKIYIVLTKT